MEDKQRLAMWKWGLGGGRNGNSKDKGLEV